MHTDEYVVVYLLLKCQQEEHTMVCCLHNVSMLHIIQIQVSFCHPVSISRPQLNKQQENHIIEPEIIVILKCTLESPLFVGGSKFMDIMGSNNPRIYIPMKVHA